MARRHLSSASGSIRIAWLEALGNPLEARMPQHPAPSWMPFGASSHQESTPEDEESTGAEGQDGG